MLDKFLEEYIDKLYQNSNINMAVEQQNLYKKSDYYNLLKPVITLLRDNKDATLQELREKLLEQSTLIKKTQEFIHKREMAPGLVFSYGTKNYKETIVIGNRQEVTLTDDLRFVPSVSKMTEDTIFDLASVTKIFTSLAIYKLVSLDIINLDDEIIKYEPRFKNLKGVTIYDLLTFKANLQTSKRLETTTTYEEALNVLFDVKEDTTTFLSNPYADLGAIVLRYVIESASNMSFYEFLDKYILKPLNLIDTHVSVLKYKLDRTASTIGGVRYYKDGNFNIDTMSKLGVVHDPKSKILGQKGDLPGHAGLFSTASDMSKLALGMIDGVFINAKYLEDMARNKTGKKYFEDSKEKYIQYLGSLCYSKHPRQADSELFHALSGKSIASGGFVGTQLTVDPINELFFFLGANRVHNRLIYVDSAKKDEIITLESGKKIVKINGEYKTYAQSFAWDRDFFIVHPSLKLAIQYKMLEDFYKLTNEKITYQENTKNL